MKGNAMTVSREAATQAFALALATPMTGRLLERRDRSDFGGPNSHLLKVRRIGRNYPFGDDIQDGDFGLYLGLHDGHYTVALQSVLVADIIGYESFDTLDELKRHWELD
jgi:hypothetical protein